MWRNGFVFMNERLIVELSNVTTSMIIKTLLYYIYIILIYLILFIIIYFLYYNVRQLNKKTLILSFLIWSCSLLHTNYSIL